MRCATYDPPPGSAPGYDDAHQLTPTKTRNVVIGIQLASPDGTKARIEPPPLATCFASTPASPALSAAIPPTAATAATASTIAIDIFTMNCRKSVTRTDQNPPIVTYSAVSTRHTYSAGSVGTCSVSERIFTMARLTQPMMIVLTSTPW